MKKIKTFLPLLSPLADIFSIFAFFGISANRLLDFILSSSLWISFLAIISSFFVLKIVFEKIKALFGKYENIVVKEDLEKGIASKNINQISKVIPSTRTLTILFRRVEKRASTWAQDAKVVSVNLYLDYNTSWEIPSLQVVFYSCWKKEKAYFYEGAHQGESYEEADFLGIAKIPEPFFNLNSNWQAAVNKAFNSISTRINSACKIAVHQSATTTITIYYKEGKAEKRKILELDDTFHLKGN